MKHIFFYTPTMDKKGNITHVEIRRADEYDSETARNVLEYLQITKGIKKVTEKDIVNLINSIKDGKTSFFEVCNFKG